MNKSKYDIVIIGAGPIGLACGIAAKKRKLKYLIVEKGALVNSLFHYPTNMTFFSTSERLEIGEVPFISHGVKPTRRESLEYYRRVKTSWDLNVNLYEEVKTIEGEKGNFKVVTDKENYKTSNIVIATGFFEQANLMGIPGENLPKVKHYYDEPHPYAEQKVAIIGGGNSGVDVALETFRCGSQVTLILKKDSIDKNVKYWVRPDIENRINEGVIKAYFNSSVIEIREKEIDIQTPKGIVTIENDFVLAMTGYRPDFDFLKKAGVQIKGKNDLEPQYNENTFETNVKGIFLAGVICGGMKTGKWFIENSRYHADVIMDLLLSEK